MADGSLVKTQTASVMGRPTKYDPSFVERAAQLCEQGATDMDLAAEFGVTTKTIERWRVAHPDFCLAVEDAKDNADDKIEATLYQKASGYDRQVQKSTASGAVVELKEYFPPDTASMIFWLKNRRSRKWRDRQENVNVNVSIAGEFESLVKAIKHTDDITIEGEIVDVEASEAAE